MHATGDHATPAAPASLASTELPPRVRRVLASVLAVGGDHLRRIVADALEQLQQTLQLEAAQAGPEAHEDAMLATRTLHAAAPRLATQLMAQLEAQLACVRSARAVAPRVRASTAGLSLLADNVLDEDAEIREIASRLTVRANLPLYLIGQRMGVVAATPPLEAEQLPMGPYQACEAVRVAASHAGLPPPLRIRLFRQLEPELLARYPDCVEAMNAALVGEGVLPHLTHVPVRARPPRADATPRSDVAADAPSARPVPPAVQAPAGQTAVTATPPPLAWPEEADVAATAAPATAPFDLRASLRQRRHALGRLRGEQETRQRHVLTRADVLTALARLRTAIRPPPSVGETRLAILANQRQQHGQGVALDDAEADVFDLLDLYYTRLWRELRMDAAAAGHARRLMLPVMEHAIADAEAVLADRGHAVWQLLDAATRGGGLGDPPDDEDPLVQAAVAQAVETVAASSTRDPQAFVHGLAALQAQLQPLARRAEIATRRLVDAARGREKLTLARRAAQTALQQALAGGPSLPPWHRALLDHVWGDAMTMTLLRHGEDSPAWQTLLRATARIAGQQEDESDTPNDAILQAIGQLGHDEQTATDIAGCLLEPDDARCRALWDSLRTARLGDAESADPPHPDARSGTGEDLASLAEGDWVELASGGRLVARQLAWRGQASDGLLFVGQRGQRLEDAPTGMDMLAAMLRARQARRLAEPPASPDGRAWAAVRTELASHAAGTEGT